MADCGATVVSIGGSRDGEIRTGVFDARVPGSELANAEMTVDVSGAGVVAGEGDGTAPIGIRVDGPERGSKP